MRSFARHAWKDLFFLAFEREKEEDGKSGAQGPFSLSRSLYVLTRAIQFLLLVYTLAALIICKHSRQI